MSSAPGWSSSTSEQQAPVPTAGLTLNGRDIFLLLAALMFIVAGFKMTGIRSVAGDSINEAFYQAVGVFSFGVACITIAAGLKGRQL